MPPSLFFFEKQKGYEILKKIKKKKPKKIRTKIMLKANNYKDYGALWFHNLALIYKGLQ